MDALRAVQPRSELCLVDIDPPRRLALSAVNEHGSWYLDIGSASYQRRWQANVLHDLTTGGLRRFHRADSSISPNSEVKSPLE